MLSYGPTGLLLAYLESFGLLLASLLSYGLFTEDLLSKVVFAIPLSLSSLDISLKLSAICGRAPGILLISENLLIIDPYDMLVKLRLVDDFLNGSIISTMLSFKI